MKIIDAHGVRGGAQTAKALLSVRELILEGALLPGRRVLETWVVQTIGVSRTPVRAALARLCEEGLLEPLKHGGYAVRTFTEQDAFDAIEVRGSLEGLAARRAAERGVDQRTLRTMRELLARIDDVIDKPEMTPEDLGAYSSLNEVFHLQIAEACGGQTIPRQIERISATPFAHPSGFVMAQLRQPGSRMLFQLAQEHHRSILECLVRGDAARAETVMREHARLAARNLRIALDHRSQGGEQDEVRLIRRERTAAAA